MPLSHIVRVLIVDDSLFFQTALQNALLEDKGISVVGTAGSAAEAAKKIQELSPDVITMDVEMPDVKGMDFLRRLVPWRFVPVVLVNSLDPGTFDALDAGAIDFIRKPVIRTDYNLFFTELATKIRIVSTAKVKAKASFPLDFLPTLTLSSNNKEEKIIAIGAPAGGTEAILEVLKKLPTNIPGILVMQYMPPGFTKMYVERLDRLYSFSVAEAQDSERVEPDRAYIAPGDKHMTLAKDSRGYYIKCAAGEKVSGHCPPVDVLFRSAAETAGKDAMGIILTGMSSDGAKGLLEMRKQGSFTIGQDKASCVAYDIPIVAFDIGAVVRQAPCPSVAGIIIQHLSQAK